MLRVQNLFSTTEWLIIIELYIRYILIIPQIQRQNVSWLAAEIILQTQKGFFLPFSPLPGLTLTACWSEPWLGIFANSSLRTPSVALLLSSSPSLPLLKPLSLIHIHFWYRLWAAINYVSRTSSQKGEASVHSPLPMPYQENTFKEPVEGGGRLRLWQ